MKTALIINLFCALGFGVFSPVTVQELYGNALNIFTSFRDDFSVITNYECAFAKTWTISLEASTPFDSMHAGARVDYYFDSLLELNEPWDIWAVAGTGILIGGDDTQDNLNIDVHIGVEYKFGN